MPTIEVLLEGALHDKIHKDIGIGRPAKAIRYEPRVSGEDLEKIVAMLQRSSERVARARQIEKELGLEDTP